MNHFFSEIIIDQINKSIEVKERLLSNTKIISMIHIIVEECLASLINGY